MSRIQILQIAMAAVSMACAGGVTQTYPGSERPPSEIALLNEGANTSVFAIDGTRASGTSWSLLPGFHQVWFRVRIYSYAPNTNWTIWSYCRVPLQAVAGEKYESRVRVRKETAPGLSEKLKMEVGIADSEGDLRAVPAECLAKRPDLGPQSRSVATPVSGSNEPRQSKASACRSGCSRGKPDCEGWVRLGFDVSPSGTVENARVLSACPSGKFDDAALSALSEWKYPSKTAGQKDQEVQLDFTPD